MLKGRVHIVAAVNKTTKDILPLWAFLDSGLAQKKVNKQNKIMKDRDYKNTIYKKFDVRFELNEDGQLTENFSAFDEEINMETFG